MTAANLEAAIPGLAGPARAPVRAPARQMARQERIINVAMRHFAERGYEGVRIEEIAREAGVAKGAVFGYFASKAGLFLAAYQAAARSFSSYLEAPPEVVGRGFFAVIVYWIEHTPHMIHEDWVPYRVVLLGNYCSSLQLRREITQFLLREDPYGTEAFVRFGVDRGEIRTDIDVKMVVSLVDWLMDRIQDAIVTEELDPGLFGSATQSPQMRDLRVRQFVELLRSGIGARPDGPAAGRRG
ncbi:MAG: TetR/AcrR family transcriptional regulator [Streptosporangiaceae bacterium]